MIWILFLILLCVLGYLVWDNRHIKTMIENGNDAGVLLYEINNIYDENKEIRNIIDEINNRLNTEKQEVIDDYEKQIEELISFTKDKLQEVGIKFDK
ncbi:hypothetical protein [Gluconobacter albidus]|uniref:Uncharacterized protein n=2 Tax=Gluconobacter albidus TaxID=318683 RepID=A0AAW3R0P4_9PROT|nr:hypothetical protein [Gluconobacter albidus]KXV42473.1 hypothetical protein AD941_00750 [Gluconobacter albidus]